MVDVDGRSEKGMRLAARDRAHCRIFAPAPTPKYKAAVMCRAGSSGNLARMAITLAPMMAILLSSFAIWFLFEFQAVCPRCSGRGGHRSDCPDKESLS